MRTWTLGVMMVTTGDDGDEDEIIGDGSGGSSVRGNEGNDGSAHNVTGTCTAGGVDGTRSWWLHVAEDSPTAGNVPNPLKSPSRYFTQRLRVQETRP